MEYAIRFALLQVEIYKNSKYFFYDTRHSLFYLNNTDKYIDLYEKFLNEYKISFEAVEKLIDIAIKRKQHQTYLILLKYKFQNFKTEDKDLIL
jgi:hypothetical protein